MQIRLDELQEHLEKGLSKLYAVYGSELLLVQEACDRIRSTAYEAGFRYRSIYTIDRGFDWIILINAVQGVSLFYKLHLVEIRIQSGKITKEGTDVLKRIVISNNPNVLLLISLPYLNTDLKKSAWFNAIVDYGITLKIDPIERVDLPNWIAQRLSMQEQYVADGKEGWESLQLISDLVEGNLLAAYQEIQKLKLLYPKGLLSLDKINNAILSVARYDVFKIKEIMLSGNSARIARMIAGLKDEGVAILLVMWVVVEELHVLLRIKRGIRLGKQIRLLLQENRVRGSYENLIRYALDHVSELVLEKALVFSAKLDRQIKGITIFTRSMQQQYKDKLPPDPWDGLFQLALILVKPELF